MLSPSGSQGSILGLLCCFLSISMDFAVNCKLHLYADDSALMVSLTVVYGPSRVGRSPTRRAKIRKKVSKVWGKIRKIDWNLRKKMRKVEPLPTWDCEAGYGPGHWGHPVPGVVLFGVGCWGVIEWLMNNKLSLHFRKAESVQSINLREQSKLSINPPFFPPLFYISLCPPFCLGIYSLCFLTQVLSQV